MNPVRRANTKAPRLATTRSPARRQLAKTWAKKPAKQRNIFEGQRPWVELVRERERDTRTQTRDEALAPIGAVIQNEENFSCRRGPRRLSRDAALLTFPKRTVTAGDEPAPRVHAFRFTF